MNIPENMEALLTDRLAQLVGEGKDTIGDMMRFSVVRVDLPRREILLRCTTAPWMRNLAGTLHGGVCAAVVDQAMGFVAWCAKPGEGTAPTVQLQVSYLRPLIPGEDVLVRIGIVSITRSLIHLSSEAALASAPEKPCISATGIYFYKPKTEKE